MVVAARAALLQRPRAEREATTRGPARPAWNLATRPQN